MVCITHPAVGLQRKRHPEPLIRRYHHVNEVHYRARASCRSGNKLPDEGLHLTSLHPNPSILHVLWPVRLHVGVLHLSLLIASIVTAEPPATTAAVTSGSRVDLQLQHAARSRPSPDVRSRIQPISHCDSRLPVVN